MIRNWKDLVPPSKRSRTESIRNRNELRVQPDICKLQAHLLKRYEGKMSPEHRSAAKVIARAKGAAKARAVQDLLDFMLSQIWLADRNKQNFVAVRCDGVTNNWMYREALHEILGPQSVVIKGRSPSGEHVNVIYYGGCHEKFV